MSVSACVFVCLSARIYPEPHARFLPNVAYGRSSILLRRRCDTLCTSGFVDDIIFFYSGPCSGMNFATKDRFRLNLLIFTVKSNKIHYSVIKGHSFDLLFRNYSQTKVKEERRNLTINGKKYQNAPRRGYCYYSNVERWRR